MSRAIKFRAWFPQDHWITKQYKQMIDDYAATDIFEMFGFWSSDEGIEYMQYTGLKDKAASPIYEGDLLQNKYGRIGKVIWHEYSASFDTVFVKDTSLDMTIDDKSFGFKNSLWHNHVEVIGNIFQDSELLEDK